MNLRWHKVLRSLPLTKKEKKIVNSFFHKEDKGCLLPVVSLLRNFGLKDDSLSLLKWGVFNDPDNQYAKVKLVEYLYDQGKLQEVQRLINLGKPLINNLASQKILFKMAVLFENSEQADQIFYSLHKHPYKGDVMKSILFLYKTKGLLAAKQEILYLFEKNSIAVSHQFINMKRHQYNKSNSTKQANERKNLSSLLKKLEGEPLKNCYLIENSAIFNATERSENLGKFVRAYTYESYNALDKSLDMYKTLAKPGDDEPFFAKKISQIYARKDSKQKEIEKNEKIYRSLVPKSQKETQIEYLKYLLDRCHEKKPTDRNKSGTEIT